MARPATANYTRKFSPDEGELMTVEEYLGSVECGGFIDDDGMGEAVRDGLAAEYPANEETGWPDWIKPSWGIEAIPEDATHVLWFNR